MLTHSTGHWPAHSRQAAPQSDVFKLQTIATASGAGALGAGRTRTRMLALRLASPGSWSDHGS